MGRWYFEDSSACGTPPSSRVKPVALRRDSSSWWGRPSRKRQAVAGHACRRAAGARRTAGRDGRWVLERDRELVASDERWWAGEPVAVELSEGRTRPCQVTVGDQQSRLADDERAPRFLQLASARRSKLSARGRSSAARAARARSRAGASRAEPSSRATTSAGSGQRPIKQRSALKRSHLTKCAASSGLTGPGGIWRETRVSSSQRSAPGREPGPRR